MKASSFDTPLGNPDLGSPDRLPAIDVEIESNVIPFSSPTGEGPRITELPDGGVQIDYEPDAGEEFEVAFGDNLAEHLDERDLAEIASGLISDFREDLNSRAEWEKAYRDGLEMLGVKIDKRTQPWAGACGVVHPLLSEAAIRFAAQSIMEIHPATGPVKTQIVGLVSPDNEQQADRVKNYMNYLLTTVMQEYRDETEQLLYHLALAGSAFRKIYMDETQGRPVAIFVPAEDIVLSYSAANIETAPRLCHVMRKTPNELRKLQAAGLYRSDIDIGAAPLASVRTDISEAVDKQTGMNMVVNDDRHQILEFHLDLDLPGFEDEAGIELPYIVTVNKDTSEVYSIYRNWAEADPHRVKRQHFVHYKYTVGLGVYGWGLIHLIGGIAKGSTSILRQLVDAGTLSNLPGGFKTKGFRSDGDDTPIEPGEFRDIDVPPGKLAEHIMPLPFKEPSAVLMELLRGIVEEGREFASIAKLEIGENNAEAPVGTTLALIERNMKVMSAIHARLHAAAKREFKLLAEIIRDHLSDEPYEYAVAGGQQQVKQSDFDDRVDVIPVSDPNATSFAQRIMQQQASLEVANTAPQLYNLKALHRQMQRTIGIDEVDAILPDPKAPKPMDPVSENAIAMTGQPMKALEYQDHESHIAVHSMILQDPKFAQNPMVKQIVPAIAAHISEHMAFAYRREVAQAAGVELPPLGQPLPPQLEIQISAAVAQAAGAVTGKHEREVALEQAAANAVDPVLLNQQEELRIKGAEVERKAEKDRLDAVLERLKIETREESERERLAVQIEIAEMQAREKHHEHSGGNS